MLLEYEMKGCVMMKKILACLIALSVFVSSSGIIFAIEGIDGNQIIAEKQADIVEEVVDTSDVNDNIDADGTDFNVEGESLKIDVPIDSSEEIRLETFDGNEFDISFPENIETSNAVVTQNGTVIYNGDKDVSVAVQAIQEKQDDLTIEGVRSMVIIDNANAPKEYSFEYNLPKGCELITSEEYYGTENAETGWIYIIDKNNTYVDMETGEEVVEIVAAIEPAWAKDANGNNISTSYRVSRNVLTQVVQFDENSAFPIVADPTTSTKPDNYKIGNVFKKTFYLNNSTLGLPGLTASAASTALTKKAKEKATSLIVAKLGSKVIPAVSWVILGLSAYCTYQGYKGYSHTKVTLTCDKWAIYKHQGGKWVKGIGYKANLSFAGANK